MSALKRNIVANFAGNGWTALLALAMVPFYIRALGVEAYGLIGLFVSLSALLALLDLGLSGALNRELARQSAAPAESSDARHLVRTLEILYWGAACLIALVVIFLADPIASFWLNLDQVPHAEAHEAIQLMGLSFALRWPAFLYSGALNGLERQVALNWVKAGVETYRSVGAALVLWLFPPTLETFFYWQISASALMSATLGAMTWRFVPGTGRARFELDSLKRIWRYAAGLSAVAITAVVLTHMDKVVLSKMLSLKAFGYYTLAWAVAIGLRQLIGPLSTAYLPRFAHAVAAGNEAAFSSSYHQAARLMAMAVIPAGLTISLFSETILLLWTRQADLAVGAHRALSILVLGTALNGLMVVPYAAQLAHGWTKLALYANLVAIVVLVPLVYVLARWRGGDGAALGWMILNLSYVLICVQIMHRRLLRGQLMRWYLHDVLAPLVGASVGLVLISQITAPNPIEQPALAFVYLATAYLAALAGTTLAVKLCNRNLPMAATAGTKT